VYDGGGINPDVIVGAEKPNPFIEKLLKSPLIFDYSNQYYHNNTVDNLERFQLDKKEFERFKTMSLKEKYSTIGGIQDEINQLKNTLSEQGLGIEQTGFKDLEIALRASKLKLMDTFESEISAVLEEELIKRYFYREGMYTYFLDTSKEVIKAQEVITDLNTYNNILK